MFPLKMYPPDTGIITFCCMYDGSVAATHGLKVFSNAIQSMVLSGDMRLVRGANVHEHAFPGNGMLYVFTDNGI